MSYLHLIERGLVRKSKAPTSGGFLHILASLSLLISVGLTGPVVAEELTIQSGVQYEPTSDVDLTIESDGFMGTLVDLAPEYDGSESHKFEDGGMQSGLSRRKRSILDPCPSKARVESGNGTRSYMIYYEPKEFREIRIDHDGHSWRQGLQSLAGVGFNASQPTLIYLHAFIQSSHEDWLNGIRVRYKALTSELGRAPPFNLFFFDWSDYSQNRYSKAAGFVPHIGLKFGQLLEELSNIYNHDLSKVQVVCHSLSAHIAGLASRYLQERGKHINRIIALDPTGVCFQPCTEFGKEFALRNTDAPLVVSSHYDIGKYGSRLLPGGLDIIVNGGTHQPHISGWRGWLQLVGEVFANSHLRAAVHESQKIPANFDCHEMAYSCTGYIAFIEGECGSCGAGGEKCYYMDNFGEMRFLEQNIQVRPRTYQLNTQMYLQTGPRAPFCLHHYQVVVNLKPEATEKSKNILKTGNFLLRFGSTLEVAPSHPWTTTSPKMQPTSSPQSTLQEIRFTALGLVSGDRLAGEDAQLEIKASKEEASELLSSLKNIELNYMSHPIEKERQQRSIRLCWSSSLNSLEVCQVRQVNFIDQI